jgi:hypothetical protein
MRFLNYTLKIPVIFVLFLNSLFVHGQSSDSTQRKSAIKAPVATPAILDSVKGNATGNWLEKVKFLLVDNKNKDALAALRQRGESIKIQHQKEIDSLKAVKSSSAPVVAQKPKQEKIVEAPKEEEPVEDSPVEIESESTTDSSSSNYGWLILLGIVTIGMAIMVAVFFKRASNLKNMSLSAKKHADSLNKKIQLQPQLEMSVASLSNDIDLAMSLTAAETPFMSAIVNDKNNPHIKPAKEIISGTQILKRMVTELPKSTSSGLKKTNVNRLIEEVSVQAYYSMRDHYPDFSCEMRRDLEKILPDTDLKEEDIRFVLFNILENAFESVWLKKSTAGKGYIPSVTITSRKLPRYIQVRVKDNGTGIPDSVRKQIFEPFFSDRDDSRHIGLGLFESYDIIVNKYKGDLILENDFQSSTDFIIRLPLKS